MDPIQFAYQGMQCWAAPCALTLHLHRAPIGSAEQRVKHKSGQAARQPAVGSIMLFARALRYHQAMPSIKGMVEWQVGTLGEC